MTKSKAKEVLRFVLGCRVALTRRRGVVVISRIRHQGSSKTHGLVSLFLALPACRETFI